MSDNQDPFEPDTEQPDSPEIPPEDSNSPLDDGPESSWSDTEDALGDSADVAAQARPPSNAPKQKSYESANFHDLQQEEGNGGSVPLESLLDIPVTISMELGRAKLPISNLLRLNQGSVISLDRLAGEPLDVLVNGCLIAHGEVVVVNDRFGIRLTDVISKQERVRNLRQ